MSGSGRKRSSKWDLREESRNSFENVEDDAWPGKAGMSFHDKESQRGWISPEAANSNRAKWSSMELLPGRRGFRRDDNVGEDRERTWKAMTAWDGDDSYGTRMSPGLDEWRKQNRHYSPKNEWKRARRSRSRSRSRSPVQGFRRESGVLDRSKGRSGVSGQLCKDFVAGRCRKGSHCNFLHEGSQDYEDNWERQRKTITSKYSNTTDAREQNVGSGRSTDCTDFLKGNCRRGASCRFAHHGASDMLTKGGNEIIRERDDDRRHRDASPERRGEREIRRPSEIPCKFFAAGNCRNGKYCRFSHYAQAHASPERRPRDGRWSRRQSSDDDINTASDGGNLNGDKNENVGTSESRLTAWSRDDRWGHSLDENKLQNNRAPNHGPDESDIKEVLQWKTENASDKINVSEKRATESWLGDTDMSPDWKYSIQPSNSIDKGVSSSLPSHETGITREASGKLHDATEVVPPITNEVSFIQQDYNLRGVRTDVLLGDSVGITMNNSHTSIGANAMAAQSFIQNGPSLNSLSLPLLNTAGQKQVAITMDTSRGGTANHQNQVLFQEARSISKPDSGEANVSQVNSGITMTRKMLTSEQYTQTQLTHLKASLEQLLANGQQLPQVLAVHNPHGTTEVSGLAIHPNQAADHQKQHDFISDIVQPEKHNENQRPPGFSPNLTGNNNNVADGRSELHSKNFSPLQFGGAPNGDDCSKAGSSADEPVSRNNQLNHLEPGANSEGTKDNNGATAEDILNIPEDDKTAQDVGSVKNVHGEGKADDSKKSKEAKGLRAFKFSLVEFVKELLKPSWKEGQISKDAYKNIVKKVVDKVTGTMQGSSIPQSQEKIEHYLSSSKPKLTKLVQAYVEKFQKDK